MTKRPYTQEFKMEAVKQITARGRRVSDVAARIGVSQHSLYKWTEAYAVPVQERQMETSQTEELRRLRAELNHVREERDIQKKSPRTLPASPDEVRVHQSARVSTNVRCICKVMQLHPSGYYAWKAAPQSPRAEDDQRLLGLLIQAWLESGGVYGYRKLTLDMRDLGERCGKHRVARLFKIEGLCLQTGYGLRPGLRDGKPAVGAPNHLQRQFIVAELNKSWVTDITYIRTHEGWLYLAVVLDLCSRQVVGLSMSRRLDTRLVLDAPLMALWRRQPHGITHSAVIHRRRDYHQ
ncbi:IS3 family transposase [Acidovorax sp. Root219]|uniref:IS3 family transposase n=1 Tax=Acidovorax sp. Root219 TaxID=1736493 RepID=UPI000AC8049E|nr:IS3 family transposase [Acidovorax sp. Root219]